PRKRSIEMVRQLISRPVPVLRTGQAKRGDVAGVEFERPEEGGLFVRAQPRLWLKNTHLLPRFCIARRNLDSTCKCLLRFVDAVARRQSMAIGGMMSPSSFG